jgi:protein phosphatase
LLRDDELALGHVGDSRAYVLRNGKLKRLTKDHSLVEELRRQGRLTEEQAEEHPSGRSSREPWARSRPSTWTR